MKTRKIGDRLQWIISKSCVAGVYTGKSFYDFSNYQLKEYRSWYKVGSPLYLLPDKVYRAGYLGTLCINEGADREYLGEITKQKLVDGISKSFARIADNSVRVEDDDYISENNYFVVTAKIGKATKVWRRVSRSSYMNLFSGKELSEYINNVNSGINILEVNVFGDRKNAIKFMYGDEN